ncbi:MAG: carbamoyltransferase N-terminal domain-containing protein, partial [Thermodesulfovibrionales bacterium]
MKNKCILSFTTSGHGVGGALCIDGQIVAANTLERLSRVKYDIMLPISKADLLTFGWKGDPYHYKRNIDLPFDLGKDNLDVDFNKSEKFHKLLNHLLEAGGVRLKDVDCVTYSYRHNESAKRFFTQNNPHIKFIVPEHHFAHVCQAYLSSPFEDAAILVIDGQGVPMARTNDDPLSGCLAHGKGKSIEVLWDLPVKYSLGGLYAEVTKLCGFKTNEEGKTMGLAPYGDPEFYLALKKKLKFAASEYSVGDIRKIFKTGLAAKKYLYSFRGAYSFLRQFPEREKKEEFTDISKKLAFAGQRLIEDIMTYLVNWLYDVTGSKNLCISGGVGLNCVANYKVFAQSKFENIFVYPNAGDNGLCVGQALYVYNVLGGNDRKYVADHDYLG